LRSFSACWLRKGDHPFTGGTDAAFFLRPRLSVLILKQSTEGKSRALQILQAVIQVTGLFENAFLIVFSDNRHRSPMSLYTFV
jgi:hypothetical protein